MHLVIPAHVYFFWMRCHPSRTFLLKELEQEPQNRLPFLPTTRPHPFIPLTRGPPPLYWLGTGRWCLSLVCMLHFHLNPLFSGLHAFAIASAFVWFCCTVWYLLTLATWMIHGPFGFYSLHSISSSNWVLFGCGPFPSYLAHVPFCLVSMGWLVLLPCHCTSLAMISLILLPSCYLWAYRLKLLLVHFLHSIFFWALIASILTRPAYSMP